MVRSFVAVLLLALTVGARAGTPLTPPPSERPQLPRDADHALRVEVTWIWGLPGITLLTSQRTAEWNRYSFKQKGSVQKLFNSIEHGLDQRNWHITETSVHGTSRKMQATKQDMGLTISIERDPKVGPTLVVQIGKTR